MQVVIINKKKVEGKVKAVTVEGDAKKDKDYVPVNEIIRFEKGQYEAKITIKIIDDDQWNPDREFFVKLYDVNSDELITGKDRETRITIIDDDKPGFIGFEKKDGSVKVSADSALASIKLARTNGCDGVVTVYFKTVCFGQDDAKNA